VGLYCIVRGGSGDPAFSNALLPVMLLHISLALPAALLQSSNHVKGCSSLDTALQLLKKQGLRQLHLSGEVTPTLGAGVFNNPNRLFFQCPCVVPCTDAGSTQRAFRTAGVRCSR
jgi:hypothetical protein